MDKPLVFLTGASGTVGSGVLDVLLADGGFDVTCLVRNPVLAAELAARGVRVVIGDMTDEALFARLRATSAFTFVIHAAQASYRHHAPAAIDTIERAAVANLEKLCCSATQLMIFTNGVWMYGNGARGQPITEDTPLKPFELSRERVELLRELMTQRKFPWAQLCPPSMVYFLVGGRIAERLRRGESVDVLDDASVLWSVIERLDLGRAFVALLRHGRPGDNFLVAEDAPVSVIDFYETIAAAVGNGRVVRQPLEHYAAGKDVNWLEVMRTSQPVDASRFKQRTGWRAQERFVTSAGQVLRQSVHHRSG